MKETRILVVEDETVISMQLEDFLRSVGFENVWRASTAEEMITMARKEIPDLILTDIVMPGKLDGIDAAGIIKKEMGLPVIFLTAYGNDDLIERANSVEPLAYILKPFKLKEIEATIKIAINKICKDKQLKKEKEDLEALNSHLKERLTDNMARLAEKENELRVKITEQVQVTKNNRVLIAEQETLWKEVNHRVRNNLQVIYSLLSLQVSYIKDKVTRDLFKKSQDRIKSMALVHDQSYQSRNLEKINFSEFTRNLTNHLFRSYEINADKISVEIDMDGYFMEINNSVYCGLIITELVSNSLAYAFPDSKAFAGNETGGGSDVAAGISEGKVKLSIRKISMPTPGTIELAVRDNGVGFPKDLDFRNTETLGMQLICILTAQLKGTIELNRNNGTEFKITFKESVKEKQGD